MGTATVLNCAEPSCKWFCRYELPDTWRLELGRAGAAWEAMAPMGEGKAAYGCTRYHSHFTVFLGIIFITVLFQTRRYFLRRRWRN